MLNTINPVARIIALLLFTTPLLISVDIVSAAVSLTWTIMGASILGVPYRVLFRRSLPIILITPISGMSMVLYGRPEGQEYFSFFFAHVTDNSLSLAAAIMVRVLAVGLPVIVLLGTIDPTELGDGLSQNLKLPPRFVIGTVAGARLVSLFRRDWEAMQRARRVRGLDGQGRIRRALTMTFGLLVLAIRRGTKLATAMEARGFGLDAPRTWARESHWGTKETKLVVICFLAGIASIGIAVWCGSFRFLGA
ncbi:MAG: energy-coupling factor transporter transmembrane component T [Corynebacterium sp.]|nr:energy-coupling factor transporter transmembrane component T [Corynebacterium sp.]